jgi:hypothetical protein
MKDGPHALQAPADDGAVGNRPGHGGERRGEQVEPHDVAALLTQDADERLTQMPGAAGNQNPLPPHTEHPNRPGQAGMVEGLLPIEQHQTRNHALRPA